jgi:hypothetical protein
MSYWADETVLKTVPIEIAGAGDNEIIAAIPGKRMRVCSIVLVAALAVSARFKGTANLSGGIALGANVVFAAAAGPPAFLLQTEAGSSFKINLSLGVAVNGWLVYWEHPA